MTKSFTNDFLYDPSVTELFLKRFSLRAQLGVFHHEKGRTQEVVLSARIWTNVTVAHDDLKETVDYNLLSDSAIRLANAAHIDLVETFLQSWAEAVMLHPNILAGEFVAEKPEAIQGADSAGARIFRRK